MSWFCLSTVCLFLPSLADSRLGACNAEYIVEGKASIMTMGDVARRDRDLSFGPKCRLNS